MAKPDLAALQAAATAEFCAGLQPPKTAREECEDHESALDVLKDELAGRLVARGCEAKVAPGYVDAVLEVLRARDRALAEAAGVMGKLPSVGDDSVGEVLIRYEAMTREALREIKAAKFPRLEAQVHLMARGAADTGEESMRKLAAAHGLTPAAISKRVGEVQGLFNFPKNQFNKSDAACAKYRQGNRRGAKST
jgi:hypothetical protein